MSDYSSRGEDHNETITEEELTANTYINPTLEEPKPKRFHEGKRDVEPHYTDFKNIIKSSLEGIKIKPQEEESVLTSIKASLISPTKLYQNSFPNSKVFLRRASGCISFWNEIISFLNSRYSVKGIVGPKGLGKSYNLLYTYLCLRSGPHYKVLYVNDAEAMLKDGMYLVKEMIFAFAPELSECCTLEEPYSKSIVADYDFENCQEYVATCLREKRCSLKGQEIFKLVWSCYLDRIGNPSDLNLEGIIKLAWALRYSFKSEKCLVLLIDRFDVVTDDVEGGLGSGIGKKFQEMFLNDNFVKKVLWVSSQNNTFIQPKYMKYKQLFTFYTPNDTLIALIHYVVLQIDDEKERKEWLDRRVEDSKFLYEKTRGNPLEVELLLNEEGPTIQEKWQTYFKERLTSLSSSFLADNNKLRRESFKSLLLMVDYEGVNLDQFNVFLSNKFYKLVYNFRLVCKQYKEFAKDEMKVYPIKTISMKIRKVIRFESGDELAFYINNSIVEFQKNQFVKKTQEACLDAVMFLPSLDSFPFVDFFIFIPFHHDSEHLLILFKTHFVVKIGASFDDVIVKEKSCPAFQQVIEKVDEIPNVKKQFICALNYLAYARYNGLTFDPDSWFMDERNVKLDQVMTLSSPNAI